MHHSGWQNLAHSLEHMPEEQARAGKKAAALILLGAGAVYLVSALAGFRPGMDAANSLIQANPQKPF